jgi:hypothetical protein
MPPHQIRQDPVLTGSIFMNTANAGISISPPLSSRIDPEPRESKASREAMWNYELPISFGGRDPSTFEGVY